MTINYIYIACLGECKGACALCKSQLTALLLGTALLAYDSLLTLSEEVQYIWKNKWKLGTVLYILARYATILFILTAIINFFSKFLSLPVLLFLSSMTFIDKHDVRQM